MPGIIASWLLRQARSRLSIVATASRITFRPSAFADEICSQQSSSSLKALKFFVGCVGIVLAIEGIFSFTFNTAFSDLVHHSFPVLVALFGGVTLHAFLKLLATPGIRFTGTLNTALYVGGAALVFMITTIFVLLTADFLAHYRDIKTSSCAHRTIICLISGGTLTEYDVPRRSSGSLGMSFPFILLIMLATLIHYSRVLAKALKASMGVAAWRTYLAAAISVILLSPASLLAINTIYRALYSQP
jgi:hypothetical protein